MFETVYSPPPPHNTPCIHLQELQIFMKLLLEIAFDIRKILWKFDNSLPYSSEMNFTTKKVNQIFFIFFVYLKILFNIVEERLKKLLDFDVSAV